MRKRTIGSSDDSFKSGRCIATYSDTGVGKTDSLVSLPGKVCIFTPEPKDDTDVITSALERRGELGSRKVDLIDYDNFKDLIATANSLHGAYQSGAFPYDSLAFDVASFAQSRFKREHEDARHNYRLSEGGHIDSITDEFAIELADWGKIASMMIRVTSIFNEISKFGVNVVMNTWVMSNPKWDRTLQYAPFFQGQEYAKIMMGFFNLMGMLVPNPNNALGTPPIIRFVSPDKSFLTRSNAKLSTGNFEVKNIEGEVIENWPGSGPLDYEKIIETIKS